MNICKLRNVNKNCPRAGRLTGDHKQANGLTQGENDHVRVSHVKVIHSTNTFEANSLGHAPNFSSEFNQFRPIYVLVVPCDPSLCLQSPGAENRHSDWLALLEGKERETTKIKTSSIHSCRIQSCLPRTFCLFQHAYHITVRKVNIIYPLVFPVTSGMPLLNFSWPFSLHLAHLIHIRHWTWIASS